jgi:3-hydroxyacyl-CoA dehydrogenase/alpha-ketoglutarate-dependent taurine dioxygenase
VNSGTGRRAVGLLGGGVIGAGWAARFVLNGIDVKVFDPDPEAPRRVGEVIANARRAFPRLVDAPLPPGGRIEFVARAEEAVAGVEFVQESVPERAGVKRELLARADAVAEESIVFGTSTSGLRPTHLQEGMRHPERLVVGHPFNPVYLLPLVEVCGGAQTSPEAVDRAADVYRSVGMYPLVLTREIDGFVADRLLEALWREALWLVRDEIATVSQIDDAIRFGPGLRWSAMGTLLLYRMAGGEAGMRHFMDQFGPALKWPWSKLTDVPELTEQLLDRLEQQSDEQAAGRSIRELEALRDECLVAVMAGLRDVGFGAGEVVADHARRLADLARDRHRAEIPYVWLRDNCPCAECMHPQTGERLLDTFALDPDVRPTSVVERDGVLAIDWVGGHHTEFALAWLDEHAPDGGRPPAGLPERRHWGAELAAGLPDFEYLDVVSGDETLLQFLETVWSLGLSVLRHAPATEATLRDLARRIGHVRATNFGPDFHVEATREPNNVAYTAVELRPHTDLPYHQHPPGIQFLHCFEADAPGGESTLADGFWVADRVRREDPGAFRLLCETPIPYRFRDEGTDLQYAAPVIERNLDGTYREVRFHNALMAPLDVPPDRIETTYAALRTFDRVARSEQAQVVLRLRPGDVMVFDNRRVLHGRRAFDPGGGTRRFFGLYVDDDDWRSRIRVLRAIPA